MPQVSFSVETATLLELQQLQRWTCWAPGQGVACLVGGNDPDHAFATGRLRVVAAAHDGRCVGISLVASPAQESVNAGWRPRSAATVPASESLLWVGMAICPALRRSGLAPALVRRTLDMAATTGYPFIAAVFPISDERASTLLVRSGFARAEPIGDDAVSGRLVYLRSTPNLIVDRASALAC